MQKYGVRNLVFSSSATVYGEVTQIPPEGLHEDLVPLPATNPYGRTKFFIEEIAKDLHKSEPGTAASLHLHMERLEFCDSALLQSSWCSSQWSDRRGPTGNTKQPHALCYTGGSRKKGIFEHLWE